MTALDSSVAIPALALWHEAHRATRGLARDAVIPAHARIETYAVLTRLPPPHRTPASLAAEALDQRFPGPKVLVPSKRLVTGMVERCAGAGIDGGSVYDALVGLTAAEHRHVLLTRDARAASTYDRLGVAFDLLT